MATYQYFLSPPPLPFVHPFSPPPPPHVVPPPPHVVPPPPPPHVRPQPPPPFHPVAPPPHIPPPPSPDNAPTVVIVVFVSFGCFFFAAFSCFALWCLMKRRKQKKMVNETDIISTDEHLRVKEAVVQGPNGPELVVLSIEDDKHTHEEIIKNERMETKQLHANAKSGDIAANDSNNQIHNLL